MRTLAAATVCVLCTAAPAFAQDRPERAWLSVSGGVQAPTSSSFSDTFDIQRYTETGHVTGKYPIKSEPFVAGSFGVRIWKRLGAGVGITHISGRGSADVSAGIPHPFFDNQPRNISGTASASRSETGAHIQLAWLMPIGSRARLVVAGGPSVLSISQTFVTDVHYSETYPYDTALFSYATTTRASRAATGFNAGADVAWLFWKNLGAGAMVQFARATAKLDAGNGRRVSVKGGGTYAGIGIRAVF